MTPLDWANLLKDYGGWGLSAILMGVIVYLDRDRQACSRSQIILVERLITALESARDATSRFEAALNSLKDTLDARGQTVGDLSHRIDLVVEKIQHGLGNLGGSMQAIVNWIEREKERNRDSARDRAEDRDRGRS